MIAYDLGKIAMHSRIFVRLTDRTQVVPDDKCGAGSDRRRCRGRSLEEQRKRRNPDYQIKPRPEKYKSNVILTTVGRCIFNDILPKEMPFYNYALTAKGSSRVIADTYAAARPPGDDQAAGRHEVARLQAFDAGRPELRHHRHPLARHQGTRSSTKARRRPTASRSSTAMGAITDQERYAALIDVWGHARKQVTEDLMAGLSERLPRRRRPPVAAKAGGTLEVPQPDRHDGGLRCPR